MTGEEEGEEENGRGTGPSAWANTPGGEARAVADPPPPWWQPSLGNLYRWSAWGLWARAVVLVPYLVMLRQMLEDVQSVGLLEGGPCGPSMSGWATASRRCAADHCPCS